MKISGPALLLARKDALQSGTQLRQIVLHGLPHANAIDHRVAVNQDVSESHDLPEIRNLGPKRRMQAIESIKRFAEDLKLTLNR